MPAGGDIADFNKNKKFEHKVNFMSEVVKYLKNDNHDYSIILGDFNIAPYENDVWSHKQLLNVVSHTKIETDLFKKLLDSGPFVDIIRKSHNPKEKIFSWWSYRNKDWEKSNRGRRLDHILISNNLIKYTEEVEIYKNIRNEKTPSDHVPISLTLNL